MCKFNIIVLVQLLIHTREMNNAMHMSIMLLQLKLPQGMISLGQLYVWLPWQNPIWTPIRTMYFHKSHKQKDFHLKIIIKKKKRQTTFLFCLTKMETWSDICPFKKEKLFAALCTKKINSAIYM